MPGGLEGHLCEGILAVSGGTAWSGFRELVMEVRGMKLKISISGKALEIQMET